MYKFKTSKYKNSIGKVAKKEEWITDISAGSTALKGSVIKSSAAFVAFRIFESGNDSVGLVPIEFKGIKSKNIPRLHCHSERITDLDFSPFDDGILATGSQDNSVKLWNIPAEGLTEKSAINPSVVLPDHEHAIENILFHPTVDCLITSTSHSVLKLCNFSEQKEVYRFAQQDELIQSFSWNADGSTIATVSKDKRLRVLDPRSSDVLETTNHENAKDSRVVWLGDSDKILSTGFGMSWHRQLRIYDIRNFTAPLKSKLFDTNNGVLLPFFDADSKMLFLLGKGDSSVTFLEITDADPYVTEASKFFTEASTLSACLVPKRAMKVMQAEVNRLVQLTPSTVVPITYQVPRTSYYDFHSDIFPDTDSPEPALDLSDWLSGITKKRLKICLDPAKRSKPSLVKLSKDSAADDAIISEMENDVLGTSNENSEEQNTINVSSSDKIETWGEKETGETTENSALDDKQPVKFVSVAVNKLVKEKPSPLPKPCLSPIFRRKISPKSQVVEKSEDLPSMAPIFKADKEHNATNDDISNGTAVDKNESHSDKLRGPPEIKDVLENSNDQSFVRKMKMAEISHQTEKSPQSSRRRDSAQFKPYAGFRVSKFRHLKGTPLHESQHIKNLSDFNTSLPGECDGIHANKKRIAVPLKGMGGRIAILELDKPGRLPDGVRPVLQNGANVTDFCWDPFDDCRLAVACDDGIIRIWVIPPTGLMVSQDKPDSTLQGSGEKIFLLKFHPLARDIIISALNNFNVCIWDVYKGEVLFCLQGHSDRIFSLSWSPDGKYFATACKDTKIRIYNPRMSLNSVQEGPGLTGTRGARIMWVLQGTHLVVSGFSKVSERLINMYSTEDITVILTTISIDTSPSILVPFYDEDSKTVFFTGKGDSTIYAYEAVEETPYLFPLSHHKCPNVHQSLALLPKIVCNVRNVEFARILRLIGNVLEPITFTVPRVKMDLFQDDLFPDTRVSWEPTMTSTEWFSGMNKPSKKICLRPEGMLPLTEKSNPQAIISDSIMDVPKGQPILDMTAKEKERQLAKDMSSRIAFETTLPQDSMEGVDPAEWDE